VELILEFDLPPRADHHVPGNDCGICDSNFVLCLYDVLGDVTCWEVSGIWEGGRRREKEEKEGEGGTLPERTMVVWLAGLTRSQQLPTANCGLQFWASKEAAKL
jgi:hypothetical protein